MKETKRKERKTNQINNKSLAEAKRHYFDCSFTRQMDILLTLP